MDLVDFELEIGTRSGPHLPVSVIRSPAGEAREMMRFPYDTLDLQNRLQALEIALLSSAPGRRRLASPQERTVEQFGREMFEALFVGDVRTRFDMSRNEAARQGKGLRIKLRFEAPDVASLPWEFLFDARRADYLCLSHDTPIVRYLELSQPVEPLTVTPPLSILAMIASPTDMPRLDVDRERQRVEEATKHMRDSGLLALEWLPGSTWRHLQQALRRGRHHIFHFVGHGGFDDNVGEGLLVLTHDDGRSHPLPATQLGRLLGDHHPLRLAVLNSCEGARGDSTDVFSSTAATLVRRGTPAVLAMQYQITDAAAIELSRAFYGALADGMPVDQAVTDARKALCLSLSNTLEWGTPVLYMRSATGALFDVDARLAPATPPVAPPPAHQPGLPPAQPTSRAHEDPLTARPGGWPRFCRFCGAHLTVIGKFCNKCGQLIRRTS